MACWWVSDRRQLPGGTRRGARPQGRHNAGEANRCSAQVVSDAFSMFWCGGNAPAAPGAITSDGVIARVCAVCGASTPPNRSRRRIPLDCCFLSAVLAPNALRCPSPYGLRWPSPSRTTPAGMATVTPRGRWSGDASLPLRSDRALVVHGARHAMRVGLAAAPDVLCGRYVCRSVRGLEGEGGGSEGRDCSDMFCHPPQKKNRPIPKCKPRQWLSVDEPIGTSSARAWHMRHIAALPRHTHDTLWRPPSMLLLTHMWCSRAYATVASCSGARRA